MEKIELLEKLIEVQEMHIELIQDYNNLKNCYKDLEKIKNKRIQDLKGQIDYQDEKIAELERQNAELKKQIEELQKLIPIEVVGGQKENNQ